MIVNSILRDVGEYALLLFFFLLIYSSINRGIFSRRSAFLLALLIIVSLFGSKNWATIRALYMLLFAFIAILGKFMGIFEIIIRWAERLLGGRLSVLNFLSLVIFASLVLIIEYADDFFAPLLQYVVPSSWWRAGSWMIPALGLASVLSDSARTKIRNMFPAANTRVLLFLFVFTTGLLVPIYFPAMDLYMRIAAIFGVAVALVKVLALILRTGVGDFPHKRQNG